MIPGIPKEYLGYPGHPEDPAHPEYQGYPRYPGYPGFGYPEFKNTIASCYWPRPRPWPIWPWPIWPWPVWPARLALARLAGPSGPGPAPFPFRDQFKKLDASPMSIPIPIIPSPIMSIPIPIFRAHFSKNVFKNAFFRSPEGRFSRSRFSGGFFGKRRGPAPRVAPARGPAPGPGPGPGARAHGPMGP